MKSDRSAGLLSNKLMIRILKTMNHLKQKKEVSFKECFPERFFQKLRFEIKS